MHYKAKFSLQGGEREKKKGGEMRGIWIRESKPVSRKPPESRALGEVRGEERVWLPEKTGEVKL